MKMKTNVAKCTSGMLLLGAVATAPAQTAWNFFLSDAGGGNSLLTWTVTGSLATPPGAILTTTESRIAVLVDAPGIYVDSYATSGSPQAVPTPDGSYFQVAESSVDVPIVAYDVNNVAGSGNDSFGLTTGGLPSQLAVPGQEFLYHAGTQSALIPIDYSNFNPGSYQSEEPIFSTALTVNLTIGPVPEPPTLVLSSLSGLCGLLALRRRKRPFEAWLH